MNKAYQILRLLGYVSGLSGLALFFFARNAAGETTVWTQVAGGLLALMFVSMLVSYFLFAVMQMWRKGR